MSRRALPLRPRVSVRSSPGPRRRQAVRAIAALAALCVWLPAVPAVGSGGSPGALATSAPAQPSSSGDAVVRERLVVLLAPDADPEEIEAVRAESDLAERRRIPALDARVYVGGAEDVAEARERFRALPDVRSAELERRVSATAREPDDSHWAEQWGAQRIGAPTAWSETTGDPAVVIAVLDTGVDADHEDLEGALVGGHNAIEPGEPPRDRHGHGTMSAGVAAARSDNGLGVAGLCWQCRLMPVKVLGDDGSGFQSDVASGVVWAVENGADLISLSLGGAEDSDMLREATTFAAEQDVLVAASAGNDGTDQPFYPAAHEHVVGVAGSDRDDTRYEWTNHGPAVDLAAPGCNPATSLDDRYATYCGTSSAAPVVAGVAGLVRALRPDLDLAAVRAALEETAGPLDYVRTGRLDAAAALAAAAAAPEGDASPTPESEPAPETTAPEDEEDGEVAPRSSATLERVSGPERFTTAARISAGVFDPGVVRAYIATGEDFPDALAAGAAAGTFEAPVLPTAAGHLPAPIAEELARLEPGEVVIAGGASAVAPAVAREIGEHSAAPVRRVAGRDRYATAAALARDAFPGGASVAYLATGADFADALAGVPAAAREGGPVLLTARERLPAATAEALNALGPQRVVVLGGEAAVEESVLETIRGLRRAPGEIVRLAGADRFATAAAIAAHAFPGERSRAFLATGRDFPDALAGGAAAAEASLPLLLAEPTQLPAATAEALRQLQPSIIAVLGGQAAIADRVAFAAGEAAAAEAPDDSEQRTEEDDPERWLGERLVR